MYLPLQSITLDGLQIKYRVRGEGPDILLIHGWASSSRMWHRLMDDLTDRYRCVALDLPGFADSDKPEGDWYTIPRYVELTAKFAGALGLRNPALIGHSMGGTIGLALAASGKFEAGRLIAINPIVTGRTYLDLRLLANPWLGWPMLKLGRWAFPLTTSDVMGPWLGHERAVQVRRMREEWQQSTGVALTATLRAISDCDLTPALGQISTPTLIMIGNRDLSAPNAEGKLAARLIPGAQLKVLSTGHLPTDDVPEETAAAVEAFLAGTEVPAQAGGLA